MAALPSEGHAAAAPFRLGQSEGEATRLLYERHQRKILSFCHHQLGNREEAEDATQITFMNAFRGLKRGTSPEFESAWLYKIAHNVCLTKQRNSYRRRLVEAPSDFELIEELVPAQEGDADELFGLTSALRVLPEQQRRALLLREWQGLSYREIADEMQLSQAAVETLLFRARRSLAGALTAAPSERRGRGRPRMASNVGSGVATLKSLLVGGGVKMAATAATVAATSVVAATPVRREVVAEIMRSDASERPATALAATVGGRPHHAARVAAKHASLGPAPVALVAHATSEPVGPAVVATGPVAPRLHLIAAPRLAAPVSEQHDSPSAIVAPPPPAPAPVPTPPPPVEATPAQAPVVVDVPAPPPAAATSVPAQVAPAVSAVTVTAQPAPAQPAPVPTITVDNVIQPADPPVANAAPPADGPPATPPGQAKKDVGTADTPAPAPPADDAAQSPTGAPPGQAKKTDDAAGPGNGNALGHDKDRQP